MASRPPGRSTRTASSSACRRPGACRNVVDGQAADDHVDAVVGQRQSGHVGGVHLNAIGDVFQCRIGQRGLLRVVGLVRVPEIDTDRTAPRQPLGRGEQAPHRAHIRGRAPFHRPAAEDRREPGPTQRTCRLALRRCTRPRRDQQHGRCSRQRCRQPLATCPADAGPHAPGRWLGRRYRSPARAPRWCEMTRRFRSRPGGHARSRAYDSTRRRRFFRLSSSERPTQNAATRSAMRPSSPPSEL